MGSVKKAVFVLAMWAMVVGTSQAALAYSFSVLGVGYYPYSSDDELTNLDFGDCNAVYNRFYGGLGWSRTQYDADYTTSVTPTPVYTSPSDKGTGTWEVRAYDAVEYTYNGAYQGDYTDFLWLMGHGGSGKWYLANAYYGQSSGEEIFNAEEVKSQFVCKIGSPGHATTVIFLAWSSL